MQRHQITNGAKRIWQFGAHFTNYRHDHRGEAMIFNVMGVNKSVRIVCLIGLVVILNGCANIGKSRYTSTVGSCSSTQLLSSINSSIPNTMVVSADNFGNTEIIDAKGYFGDYHIFLTDTGRLELIELMNKSVEWVGIAKDNSIETNKNVGSVGSALNAYLISSTLVSGGGAPNIALYMQVNRYSTTNILSKQEAICIKDRLVSVPEYVKKAKAMEDKGELLK